VPCNIVIAPHADKTSSLAAHWSKPGMACYQDAEDDGSMPIMAAHTWSALQQYDNFTIFSFNSNLAATTSTYSTPTSSHSVWDDRSKLRTSLSLGVCFRVPPWPPPCKHIGPIGGVIDFMPQAKIQIEIESRTTQMQEGEHVVDVPAIDTTTPMGQAYMTRDRAYMLYSQINSFLVVHTYYSQNWMLLNHDDGLFIFRSRGDESAKCNRASSKFGP